MLYCGTCSVCVGSQWEDLTRKSMGSWVPLSWGRLLPSFLKPRTVTAGAAGKATSSIPPSASQVNGTIDTKGNTSGNQKPLQWGLVGEDILSESLTLSFTYFGIFGLRYGGELIGRNYKRSYFSILIWRPYAEIKETHFIWGLWLIHTLKKKHSQCNEVKSTFLC